MSEAPLPNVEFDKEPKRPPKHAYSFSNLTRFRKRLFNPPPSRTVGKVRSCSIVPYVQVELKDVLDGKHLPPISLKDFEEYLLYVEHSPENLYFTIWLRDYTAKYLAWKSSDKSAVKKPSPALTWTRAKRTFFSSSSYLELNLPEEMTTDVLGIDGQVHPSELEPIKAYVEGMLRGSLQTFVGGVCGNSGRRRGLFGIGLGFSIMLLGLIPLLLSILHEHPRAVRIAVIPCFWIGAWALIASLHGVCVIIYLFGDARQLYPFELARVDVSHPIPLQYTGTSSAGTSTASTTTTSFHSTKKHQLTDDIEALKYHDSKLIPASFPTVIASTRMVPTSSAGFILPSSASSTAHEGSQSILFDFDALPLPPDQHNHNKNGHSCEKKGKGGWGIPTFGPLTGISSDIITRAQWEIVIRSFLLGGLVTVVLGAVCIAVPPHRHLN